ncbi:putative adhesin [Endozoicomonas lisbonensis]|uniref:Putative adhesin Stv domain-containing protein n=1 Tax=Endozoicomonas lisbonensis TaxID=3120522 RepID=A0ABV2SGR3_9GAMM
MPIFSPKPKLVVNESVLSNSLNLYTCQSGDRKVQSVFIYCHGHYKPKKPGVLSSLDITVVPSGAWLYFYVPHGSVLITSLAEAMAGEFEPLETYMPGQKVANYILSPLEGRYSDAGFIKGIILRDRLGSGKKAKKHPLRECDVVQPKWDIRLGKLIDMLQWTDNLYPRVHCLFCRESVYRRGRQWYDPAIEESPHVHQSDVGRWQII